MSINLKWDDAWAFCKNTSDENRAAFLKQTDWKPFIRGLSAEYQIEVLKNAPKDVLDYVKNELLLEARLELKLTNEPKKPDKPKSNRRVSFRILMT